MGKADVKLKEADADLGSSQAKLPFPHSLLALLNLPSVTPRLKVSRNVSVLELGMLPRGAHSGTRQNASG